MDGFVKMKSILKYFAFVPFWYTGILKFAKIQYYLLASVFKKLKFIKGAWVGASYAATVKSIPPPLLSIVSFFIFIIDVINPIQDGYFRGCSRMGEQKGPTSLKSVTHILQWWNQAQLYLT